MNVVFPLETVPEPSGYMGLPSSFGVDHYSLQMSKICTYIYLRGHALKVSTSEVDSGQQTTIGCPIPREAFEVFPRAVVL